MLSKELASGESTRRSVKTVGMPSQFQARLQKYCPPSIEESKSEEADNTPEPMAKRRKCYTCTRDNGRRRLSRYECKKCHTALCLEHAILVCKSYFVNEITEQNK